MNLLVLDIQSTSDIITNSSSEVFVLRTDKTCEEVNTILKGITCGFMYPEVFHIDEYRKWRERPKDIRDSNYLYDVVKGWFIDPENETDMINHYRDFLFSPWKNESFGSFSFQSFGYDCYHQINIDFWKFLDKYTKKIKEVVPEYKKYNTFDDFLSDKYNLRWQLPDFIIKKFMESYKGEFPSELKIPRRENALNLDGKVLVLSESDNSIPYDTWDKIENMFDCYNVHLG